MITIKELKNKYEEVYLEIQKKLSEMLLQEKDETKIALLRAKRNNLGELYEMTMKQLSLI